MNELKCKCPSCEKIVYPIINISDLEQKNDFFRAVCPECHFNTGNRMSELDAFQFFKYLGECLSSQARDKTFEEFWASIVLNKDGSLNAEQIKKELFDLYTVMQEVREVYDNITGGSISKINTKAECVIDEVERYYEKMYSETEDKSLFKQRMIKVYVAGKYSDTNVRSVLNNIRVGIQACKDLLLRGYAPFCPWLDYMFLLVMNDSEFSGLTVDTMRNYSMEWLKVCACVLVLDGYETSLGTIAEIKMANKLGIPVYYGMDDFLNEKRVIND